MFQKPFFPTNQEATKTPRHCVFSCWNTRKGAFKEKTKPNCLALAVLQVQENTYRDSWTFQWFLVTSLLTTIPPLPSWNKNTTPLKTSKPLMVYWIPAHRSLQFRIFIFYQCLAGKFGKTLPTLLVSQFSIVVVVGNSGRFILKEEFWMKCFPNKKLQVAFSSRRMVLTNFS